MGLAIWGLFMATIMTISVIQKQNEPLDREEAVKKELSRMKPGETYCEAPERLHYDDPLVMQIKKYCEDNGKCIGSKLLCVEPIIWKKGLPVLKEKK